MEYVFKQDRSSIVHHQGKLLDTDIAMIFDNETIDSIHLHFRSLTLLEWYSIFSCRTKTVAEAFRPENLITDAKYQRMQQPGISVQHKFALLVRLPTLMSFNARFAAHPPPRRISHPCKGATSVACRGTNSR